MKFVRARECVLLYFLKLRLLYLFSVSEYMDFDAAFFQFFEVGFSNSLCIIRWVDWLSVCHTLTRTNEQSEHTHSPERCELFLLNFYGIEELTLQTYGNGTGSSNGIRPSQTAKRAYRKLKFKTRSNRACELLGCEKKN